MAFASGSRESWPERFQTKRDEAKVAATPAEPLWASDLQARRALGASQLLSVQRTAGNRAVSLWLQRSPASDLIASHTNWANLDERALGRALLTRATAGDHAFVLSVFDELGSTDRDDVAYEFCQAAQGTQLPTLATTAGGRRLLDRMFDELTSGSVSGEEQEQADRIMRAKAERGDPAQAGQQMRTGKVFPFRLPGLTVLSDAPVSAERRDSGQIWVHQPVRVLGTDMFREETSTLPAEVFTSGVMLAEDEIVGVKLYDLGGQVVYRPALFLVQLSNQTDTTILTKLAEVTGLALTFGTGGLAGLGVEATMTARVLMWADRAAFVLGTVTSVINEHRGEIIARWGDGGRTFLRYVDYVNSATALYGFARVVLAMPALVGGLRNAYRTWRTAGREATDAERQLVATISNETEEVLDRADEIAGARSGQRSAEGGQPGHAEGGGTGPTEGGQPSPAASAATTLGRARQNLEDVLRSMRSSTEAIDRNTARLIANRRVRVIHVEDLPRQPGIREVYLHDGNPVDMTDAYGVQINDVAYVRSSLPQEEYIRVLRHEVNHVLRDTGGTTSAESIDRFRHEFDAFWADGTFDHVPVANRADAIRDSIVNSSAYEELGHRYASDRAFAAQVDAIRGPIGDIANLPQPWVRAEEIMVAGGEFSRILDVLRRSSVADRRYLQGSAEFMARLEQYLTLRNLPARWLVEAERVLGAP